MHIVYVARGESTKWNGMKDSVTPAGRTSDWIEGEYLSRSQELKINSDAIGLEDKVILLIVMGMLKKCWDERVDEFTF